MRTKLHSSKSIELCGRRQYETWYGNVKLLALVPQHAIGTVHLANFCAENTVGRIFVKATGRDNWLLADDAFTFYLFDSPGSFDHMPVATEKFDWKVIFVFDPHIVDMKKPVAMRLGMCRLVEALYCNPDAICRQCLHAQSAV